MIFIDKARIIDIKKNKRKEKFSEEQMKILMDYGKKEVFKYRKIVQNCISEMNNLAINKCIGQDILATQIYLICEKEILEKLIIPILENNISLLPFINKKDFNKLREDMFLELYKQYLKNLNLK